MYILPNHKIFTGDSMAIDIITQIRLKTLVDYDENSGIFTRLLSNSNYTKVGDIVGCKQKSGYLSAQIDGKKYLMHRLAWLYVHGHFPEEDIDHINGIRSDNRISNLRSVTRSVNLQNKRRADTDSMSGLLGVCWSKDRNKWLAQIRIPFAKSNKMLGRFDTKEEAHQAYLVAKRKYHEGCTI